MSVNAVPVDSTQGTLKDAGFSEIKRSDRGGYCFSKTYTKTYCHYLNNRDTTPPATPDTTFSYPSMKTLTSPRCTVYKEGAYCIPYHNVGIATTPKDWQTDFVNCDKVRILHMGFDVKHTTMLQENLTNRGATTLLENVFEGKPFMMSFVDSEHIMDQNLGYVDIANATLDTAEKAHVMWAMVGKSDGNTPGRTFRTWNQLPSQPTFADFDPAFSPTAGICNAWFTRTWPLTQVEGNLCRCRGGCAFVDIKGTLA